MIDPSRPPWSKTSGETPIIDASSVKLCDAGSSGVLHYVTDIELFNTHATVSTLISILDDTTPIWTGYLPAVTAALPVTPVIVSLQSPIKGSSAKQLNIKAATTGANIYYNVQGFDSKDWG